MIEAIVKFLQRQGVTGTAEETYVPTRYVADDVSLQSLEKYGETPIFHRASFSTVRISDFNAYLARESRQEATAVFISPDAAGADAIVDMGMHTHPEWGRHRAKLTMQKTPEYAALRDICGVGLTQRNIIDFLEDYHYCITPIIEWAEQDEPTAGTVSQAIQIIRKIEIKQSRENSHEEEDYASRAEGMEAIEMRGRDGNKIVLFNFEIAPYEDTAERRVQVRMTKSMEGREPRLKLRIVAEDEIKRAVQEELEERIKHHVELDKVRVFVGNIQHQ